MTDANARGDDDLHDFEPREVEALGATRRVYVTGRGPAVLVMSEMPGISPEVARFARWVRDAGFSVYMPSLFGSDGAVPGAEEGAAVFRATCIRAEFHAFGSGKSSPVTDWLRALARRAHAECGGPGVGAIGMCFTGNFALTLMLEPAVIAPVLCQPSLPLDEPAGLEIDDASLRTIRARLERDELKVRAYRFAGDRFCTAERFSAYADALGPRFETRVLPDAAANPDVAPFFSEHVGCAHSVVTQHLIDAEGEPTAAARDEILAFFAARLQV
ncbi:MAG: dienelactone hydrolase family protein [Myxococcota bacterium]